MCRIRTVAMVGGLDKKARKDALDKRLREEMLREKIEENRKAVQAAMLIEFLTGEDRLNYLIALNGEIDKSYIRYLMGLGLSFEEAKTTRRKWMDDIWK